MDRKLRMGMVGGGKGSCIGPVHRMAALMHGRIELVCGAFSSTRIKSRESGNEYGLPESRLYGTYREMFRKEAKLPEAERMDFVTVVTPNNMHYPIAMAALDAGYHVVCDTPMTVSLDEAVNLKRKIEKTGQLFCLTHAYTGYPMVRQARRLVVSGELGDVRRVVVEYPQGWLAIRQENQGLKQAMWRMDPKRIGSTCAMADLGNHCENLAAYVTGLEIAEVCADLKTFVKGRPLDDDGNVMLRFSSGAVGLLWATEVGIGIENELRIRVYCEKGSVEWTHGDPNKLPVHWLDKPTEILQGGVACQRNAGIESRLLSGHPQGYVEAFATVYNDFAKTLTKVLDGEELTETDVNFPEVYDGIRGLAFLDAVVKSSKSSEKWTPVEMPEA